MKKHRHGRTGKSSSQHLYIITAEHTTVGEVSSSNGLCYLHDEHNCITSWADTTDAMWARVFYEGEKSLNISWLAEKYYENKWPFVNTYKTITIFTMILTDYVKKIYDIQMPIFTDNIVIIAWFSSAKTEKMYYSSLKKNTVLLANKQKWFYFLILLNRVFVYTPN